MAKNPSVGYTAVYPIKGGLETVSIPGTTTLGRMVSGYNFLTDISGSLRKNPGVVRIDNKNPVAPLGFSKGAFDFWKTSGLSKTRKTVLVASGKVLADNGDAAFVDVTGPFSILRTDNVSIDTFFGLLVMAFTNNPGGTPLKYNQTGNVAALGGSPPNAKYLRQFDNRLWAAGIGTAPDRLAASAIDNPEDWSIVGGAIQINIDQGDQDPVGLTSLFPKYYGRLIAGKRRSLYEISPVSTTYALRPIIEGIGCVAHNGAAATPTDIIFPSELGIHSLGMTDKFGQIETAYLSAQIQNLYQEVTSFDRADNMRSLYVPELSSYLLALTSKSSFSNDIVLGYNIARQEWFAWRQNVSAMCKYVDINDSRKTKVLILDDKGRVGILDTQKSGRTVTWFGERLTTQLNTGIIYPLGVTNEVTFRELTIFFKPQSDVNSVLYVDYLVNGKYVERLEFSMAANQGALIGSAIIGIDKIGSGGILKQVTRQLKGEGSAIEFSFTHEPVSDIDDCEIYGFVIEFEYGADTDLPRLQ